MRPCKIILSYNDGNPWDVLQRCFKISTLEKFDQVINQLEEEHKDKNGAIVVNVFISSEINIGLYLCTPETILNYYNPKRKLGDCRRMSLGNEKNEKGEVIKLREAYSQEELITIPKRYLISKEQALRAVRYFVQTGGQLSNEIDWENPVSRINDDDKKDPHYDKLDADVPF
ncbi:hypothetical protein PN36_34105 [Candidatus Thiomargarita nelsonii]|uniref:Uncharacterized protein n=1 Tax=Candidatus Thiomargarita nelsonii TaxID=1003181 RepID=A0A4E0QKG2_9GAMM|nr:hypothetical protein PN36_34105 [Candidatus Thiomargarita nelsonii]